MEALISAIRLHLRCLCYKALPLLVCITSTVNTTDLIHFWNIPQHGGNSFNRKPPDEAYYRSLLEYGGTWVRLVYDKWQSSDRDFLLGNADHYTGLVASDLVILKDTLADVHAAGVNVVSAPLTLPGARWKQNNGGYFDDRLWQDKAYWMQAATFWRDLALALKDTPGIAAYNLINEPAPEREGGLAEHTDTTTMRCWYTKIHGSARDLPALYSHIISTIREVDQVTPIMVDAGWYAAADGFNYWPNPLSDRRILYSFHMYEPYAATSLTNSKYIYPGKVAYAGHDVFWDFQTVTTYLQQPLI